MNRPSFYQINLFPELENLLKNWKVIQEEFLALNAPVMNLHRVHKTHNEIMEELRQYIKDGYEYGFFQGWGKYGVNPEWTQYALVINDNIVTYVKPKMANTIKLLENIKGIKACALITLNAHSSLPLHMHPEILSESLLQLHIPLVTAHKDNFSYLNVNGEFYQHICGTATVFDGSLNHFVVNESDVDRTILYMEFNKKMLSAR